MQYDCKNQKYPMAATTGYNPICVTTTKHYKGMLIIAYFHQRKEEKIYDFK